MNVISRQHLNPKTPFLRGSQRERTEMKKQTKNWILMLMALAPFSAHATTGKAPAQLGLDVNDVFVLFPLATDGAPSVRLGLNSVTASGQPLLLRAMFDGQILAFTKTKNIGPDGT